MHALTGPLLYFTPAWAHRRMVIFHPLNRKIRMKKYIQNGLVLALCVLFWGHPLARAAQSGSNATEAQPTATATTSKGRVRISAGVAESYLLTRVEPVYPQIARLTHVEGEVRLMAW